MSRAKHWCFTLNNYTDVDLERLNGLEDEDSVSYLCFGKEVGEHGTPHLQGFVSFEEKQTIRNVLAYIGQAHLSVARDVQRSITYCKKDGDVTEIGEIPKREVGRRSDLAAFKAAVDSGSIVCMKDARRMHPEVVAKYQRFCADYLEDARDVQDLVMFPLRVWQAELFSNLRLEPDDRKITFVVDQKGNSGKSWFGKYLEVVLGENSVQVLQPGKKQDMAYALNTLCRIVILDAPRSKNGDFIQYDFLEQLKDGRVFSSKYESRVKRLNACHVVVFMNEYPKMDALSEDRYDIIEITPRLLDCASLANAPHAVIPGLII